MKALATTATRVESNTADEVNERIRRQIEANVACYAGRGPAAVNERLRELDEEWDIERCLETMAPTLTLVGIAMGLLRGRRWFALPIMVQGFFLQHALQGWCPPIVVLRRLGIRTTAEIAHERNALKAIRGDYRAVSSDAAPQGPAAASQALRAARQ